MLTEPWRLQLLGGVVASLHDTRIERFRSRKVATLFAYLALHNRVPASREQLGEMLWPDEDVDTSRNRLRVTLASLRRQLEPPPMESGSVLVATRTHVSLREGQIITDVDQFRQGITAAAPIENDDARTYALREALDHYNGELLPGFYEDWIDEHRRGLEHLYEQSASEVVNLLYKNEKPAEALPYALRLAAIDPLDEQAQCRLIQVYGALGQPGNANDIFEALRIRLHEDLGVDPSASTLDLIAGLRSVTQARTGLLHIAPNRQIATTSTTYVTPSAAASRTELPSAASSFHGRQNELLQLQSLLALKPETMGSQVTAGNVRMVTLTGLGGIGKTRLGLHAAQQSAPNFPGGAWFVPLADVEDGRQIEQAIADALRIRPLPHRDLLDLVVEELTSRTSRGRALMMLDNFEQLVGMGTGVVEVMLARVPDLWLIVTSRRLLGLSAEQEFRVEPLDVPDGGTGVEQVFKSASVDLFVSRAKATMPDFQLTTRNAVAVAELCQKLEGIPLAIELAAARIRLLTPAQMVAELEQRFDLLVNRRATKDSRHRSLRAAIERSVQVLPAMVREFFAILSVFRGSWNLEAAREVSGYLDSLDMLDDLVAYSLVQTHAHDGEMRYSMLETIREFAAGLVPAEQREMIDARHARHYIAWTQTCEQYAFSSKRYQTLAQYELEKENIRVAWTWALRHDTASALDAASNLRWVYFLEHRLREGEDMILQSLHAAGNGPSKAAARALVSLAALRCYMDDFAGATDPLQRALPLLGPGREQRIAMTFSSWVRMHEGDFEGALTQLDGARKLCAANGETWSEGACLNLMGFASCYAGRTTQARELFALSRERFIKAGDPAVTGHCSLGIGRAAWMEGNLNESEEQYRTSLAEFVRDRDQRGIAYSLEGLARVASDRGRHSDALRLTGGSQRVRDHIALRRDSIDQPAHEAVIRAATVALDEASRKAAWDEGYQMGQQAADETGS